MMEVRPSTPVASVRSAILWVQDSKLRRGSNPFPVQLVAAKAVPVTEVVVDKHLKPYVKEHAGGIQAGTKQFTEEELLPRAQQVQDTLPDAVEEFTEDHLKPAAARLASEIEDQVCVLVLMLFPQP